MAQIGDREITMRRGWIVQFKDGTVLCEEDMPWISVPNKKDIRRVILKWEDRLWSFDDKEHYMVPTVRGFMDISLGGLSQGIHSRTIGYYDTEENCKVILRVDEATGKATFETIPFE